MPRERLRVVWRILLWLLLLLLFYVAGQYAVSFLPGTPLGWATYVFLSAGGLMAGWAVLTGLDGRPPGALGFAFSRAALTETVTGLGLGGGLIAAAVVQHGYASLCPCYELLVASDFFVPLRTNGSAT